MYELYPYFTNDGSVGLFSPEADDIYHSTYGALTEAYEKFIIPLNLKNYLEKNSEIKILDICFGIGYNSKSFINNFLDLLYNEPIGTNNKIIKKTTCYNDKIDANNKKYTIFIHAIDKDKILANLSPFFITNAKNIAKLNSKSKILEQHEKIKRLSAQKAISKYKLREETNIILLKSLLNSIDDETISILSDKKYSAYFDKNMWRLFQFLRNDRSTYSLLRLIKTFLHNIYYKNLSRGYKNALKTLRLIDFNFKLSIDDARQVLLKDENKYNFIFLDAFTPTKCPCLWSVEFFKLLFEHLKDGGMIFTYSNSAQVRNAFLHAGFVVKKIFSKSQNKFTGTVAIKEASTSNQNTPHNSDTIYDLSEYDLGLMKTRAGIFYHDENLSLDNEVIIERHKIEVENSDLISSSKFIKQYKKGNNSK